MGRTGTYIAIDVIIQQAALEKRVDVLGCVKRMRKNRMDMVQNVVSRWNMNHRSKYHISKHSI